jgi:hypothetical protein
MGESKGYSTMKPLEQELFGRARDTLDKRNDCAVRALSIASGLPYEAVYGLLQCLGRGPGECTPRKMQIDALECMGLKWREVTKEYDCRTIRTFQRTAKKDRIYLVFVRRHVLCVRGGEVYDWADNRLHRIQHIVIVGKELPETVEAPF